ncbi:hypothetical protein, partial [Rhizobium nepotum]|uniref:hypothetical protein n=1 Tax=Rhizobium nepotum TaxID=1035271 RepID=UPI001AEBD02B
KCQNFLSAMVGGHGEIFSKQALKRRYCSGAFFAARPQAMNCPLGQPRRQGGTADDGFRTDVNAGFAR